MKTCVASLGGEDPDQNYCFRVKRKSTLFSLSLPRKNVFVLKAAPARLSEAQLISQLLGSLIPSVFPLHFACIIAIQPFP